MVGCSKDLSLFTKPNESHCTCAVSGDGEFDITEIDITESAITNFQESDITESDITEKGN